MDSLPGGGSFSGITDSSEWKSCDNCPDSGQRVKRSDYGAESFNLAKQ